MPLANRRTFSVWQINEYAKNILTADPILSDVSVSGEISNYHPHRSGHVYFTIKDAQAALSCALFRQNAQRVKTTLREGLQVVVRGYVTIYPRDGSYQLVVSDIETDGVGALYALFEKRKALYAQMGLFDPAKKKKLPGFVRKIAVVTSPTGAVLRDIVRVARARWQGIEICLVPVSVQGEQAAEQIAKGMMMADAYCGADVIIVGRGGGSMEDLWAFNEEAVVMAAANCSTPIVSAVGHETDFTLCDFAADVRAATPSNAAELCVCDAQMLKNRVQMLKMRAYRAPANAMTVRKEQVRRLHERMDRAMRIRMDQARHALANMDNRPILRRPDAFLTILREKDAAFARRAQAALVQLLAHKRAQHALYVEKVPAAFERQLIRRKNACTALKNKLEALSPLAVLGRGYAMVRDDSGVITRAERLKTGMQVDLVLSDGSKKVEVLP